MSWALHRAWAAVNIGISSTGVPTKSTRSRQRSRIHGEGLASPGGADWCTEDLGAERCVIACVAISALIVQKRGENKYALSRRVQGKSKRRVALLPPA